MKILSLLKDAYTLGFFRYPKIALFLIGKLIKNNSNKCLTGIIIPLVYRKAVGESKLRCPSQTTLINTYQASEFILYIDDILDNKEIYTKIRKFKNKTDSITFLKRFLRNKSEEYRKHHDQRFFEVFEPLYPAFISSIREPSKIKSAINNVRIINGGGGAVNYLINVTYPKEVVLKNEGILQDMHKIAVLFQMNDDLNDIYDDYLFCHDKNNIFGHNIALHAARQANEISKVEKREELVKTKRILTKEYTKILNSIQNAYLRDVASRYLLSDKSTNNIIFR